VSPSARIAGNGATLLSHVESRGPNTLNVTVLTNLSTIGNLVGVVKLMPKLTLLD